jgi:sugar phosphate isomerase/epimerase
MKTVGFVLLAIGCFCRLASAATNPFFVFDNGLNGPGLERLDAKLDLVKELGFDGLSWRVCPPDQMKEVLDGAKNRALKVFVVYANLDLKGGKLVYDPRIKDILQLCGGTDTMLWPNLTSKQFTKSSPDGDAIAVEGLRELADLCAAQGVRIAIYPHVNMWVHRVEDALRLVKKVDRKNVGLCFNLCHALTDGAEDRIPAIIEEIAPYLFVVTINGADSHTTGPGSGAIQALGKGSYDVRIVLKKLKAVGFLGPIGLQCFRVKGDPKTVLTGSMGAWRELSKELE